MAERTLALEARAAWQIEPDDSGVRTRRWRECRAARAEEGNQLFVERGRDMHQTGIVADHECGARHEIDRLGKCRFAAEIDAKTAAQLHDLVADCHVVCRSCKPHF